MRAGTRTRPSCVSLEQIWRLREERLRLATPERCCLFQYQDNPGEPKPEQGRDGVVHSDETKIH